MTGGTLPEAFTEDTTALARFTDDDGNELDVQPFSDGTDGSFVRVSVNGIQEIFLTAFQAAALADVVGKASVAVGMAQAIDGLPIIRDDERGTSGFEVVNP